MLGWNDKTSCREACALAMLRRLSLQAACRQPPEAPLAIAVGFPLTGRSKTSFNVSSPDSRCSRSLNR